MEQVPRVKDQKLVAALGKAAASLTKKNCKNWVKEWGKNAMPEMKIVVKERGDEPGAKIPLTPKGGIKSTKRAKIPPNPQSGAYSST